MRPLIVIATLLAALAMIGTTSASAGKRMALVIGNSAYRHAVGLPNPERDAAAMGRLFREAHFDVVDVKTNLDGAAFRAALRDFTAAASDVDIAIVYFAGHGLEVGGVNYLVPTDAQLARDLDVEDEAVSLERVVRSIGQARVLRLVILDACRDNPFAMEMKKTLTSRGVGRGLARIDDDEGNSLVAFAAKAGSTAADGDSNHSPYTEALLSNLTTPGLDIRFALGKVRDAVIEKTRGAGATQVPAVYGSYGGDVLPLVPLAGSDIAAVMPSKPLSSSPPSATDATSLDPAFTKPPSIVAALPKDTDRARARSVEDPGLKRNASLRPSFVPDPSSDDRDVAPRPKVLNDTKPSTTTGSRWSHNGSVVKLLANGQYRKFVYAAVRPGMRVIGVSPGNVLFQGQRVGDNVSGTAYIFSRFRTCGQLPYPVSGRVTGNGQQIVLQGQAPLTGPNCTITGRRHDLLVFNYMAQ